MNRKIARSDKGILIILAIAFFTRILALIRLGAQYNINSDDLGYVQSGLTFLLTGTLTMHGVISAQVLPGMTWLIALFAAIFGTGSGLWLSLKLFWCLLGVLSVLGVYKTVLLFASKPFACLGAAFLLAPDFIWMDNLILTETPFMFCFIWLIYYSFRLTDTGAWRDFFPLLLFFYGGMLMRPAIGLYPFFMALYFLWRHYDWRLLVKQGLVAMTALLVFFVPWSIRNYNYYDAFIPLTYGAGNPLLLGTYQGEGFPRDDELDIQGEVYGFLSPYYKEQLDSYETNPFLWRYYKLDYDGLVARYRMKAWWQRDPSSMLKSYLWLKPTRMMVNSFYWGTVLRLPREINLVCRWADIVLTLAGALGIFLRRRHRKEAIFIGVNYLFQVGVYSYTFAFERYAQTLYFMRFILLGWGIYALFCWIKEQSSIRNRTKSRTYT